MKSIVVFCNAQIWFTRVGGFHNLLISADRASIVRLYKTAFLLFLSAQFYCWLPGHEVKSWTRGSEPLNVSTYGTSLTSKGGWQEPLQQILRNCLNREVNVRDFARAGQSSADGLANIEHLLSTRADVVLLEFAINDSALNRLMSPNQSTRNVETIIQRIESVNYSSRVYLQAMNPAWGLKSWLRPNLEYYNDAHRELATDMRIGFIDHRPYWHSYSSAQLTLMIPDGLHPSPKHTAHYIAETIAQRLCVDIDS